MRKVLIFVLTLLLASYSFAQKRAFTIADFYKIKNVTDPQISPDGKKIAYVVSTSNLEKGTSNSDIFVMNADGSNIRQLTFSEKGDSYPRWSPDGKWLMFLSTRKDGSQIWLMPTVFGELKQLTRISTGVSNPVWSPDGKYIVFATDVFPECGADDDCNKKNNDGLENGPLQAHVADELLYRHWTFYSDGRFTHTMLLNVETGEIKDMTPGEFNSPPFSLGGGSGYTISPDGKELCFISKRVKDPASSTNHDLFIIPLSGGEPKDITIDNQAYDADPKYSPDGRYIAYRKQLIPTYEADRFRLAIYDRQTGTSRILTENFDNWVTNLKWAPDSKSLFFTADEKGYSPLYQIELQSGKIKKIENVNALADINLSPDGSWIVFPDRRVDKPLELFRVDITGKSLKQLTFENKALADAVDIRPAEQIWVEGADGRMIHVFIVKPYNFNPNKKYPLIVNVHGGPQMQWADAFRGDWQVYPGAGYVVAFLNPHGSTGYGQDFTAAISKDWSGKVIEDVIKVTKYLAKLDYIDENRIGAMGWSWGGYAMDWLEGHNDNGLFKCLVSMMGVYDLRSMYGATEELWFPEWDLGGQPWNSELYETMSPSNYVQNFKTPMLVITGEMDYRVPYTQSLQLFTDLQKMDVPSRLIVFKNDGHWPNSVKSMPFYYNAHLDWFHNYLGGDPAPWDMKKMLRNQVFE
jgi:dipeptidyl aminopeptidase/acylaminoacyl peptidase